MENKLLKAKVIQLRKQGKTYTEIQQALGKMIPKSSLSYWCREITLPADYKNKIREYNRSHLYKARKVALEVNSRKREQYLKLIYSCNYHLSQTIRDKDVAKIALAMLYLGEGSKTQRGSLIFGNSNPLIINLYLQLLKICFQIDENKFRCTVQCRAGQDIKELENYWSKLTDIPKTQFYKARIDPRTIGKPLKRLDYKGVCRIDYFSADIYNELLIVGKIIGEGFMGP